MVPYLEKKCTKCKSVKQLTEFPPNKKTKDKKGSWCITCHSYIAKQYYQKNKIQSHQKSKKWQAKNPDKVKAYRRKSNYGITEEQYQELFNKQLGMCKICETHQSKLDHSLAVDHSHQNGVVRGLLCKPCNLAIGLMKEDILILKRAIDYCAK